MKLGHAARSNLRPQAGVFLSRPVHTGACQRPDASGLCAGGGELDLTRALVALLRQPVLSP